MKKQRTNNPRFLGALGFLGFLGFLGARSPEVQQWAKLSWLSLFSLLVLFPTMAINSPKASYRLNPRRKWMLVFLAGLGFLAFLHTDQQNYVGLAMVIPMLAQFAIDHKKKAAVPLKELRHIFVLMFVAIILPLGGMVWFMTAAVRNEQAAVRQRLTEVYKSQMDTVLKRVDDELDQLKTGLAKYADQSPSRRFDALLRETTADSILILGDDQMVRYPESTFVAQDVEGSSQALALRVQVRRYLSEGSFAAARTLIEEMAVDEALRNARDESGRLVLPALQLFYAQSAPDGNAVSMALRETVTDYGIEMPSARRLFYLQRLSQLGIEVEPWLSAESLLAELEHDLMNIPSPTEGSGLDVFHKKDVYMVRNDEGDAAAIFRIPRFITLMQEKIDSSVAIHDVRIVLEKEKDRREERLFLSAPVNGFGSSWYLDLYVDGDDPFAAAADRRIVRYIWIGNVVIVLMIFVFVLLARYLLTQQRLTRMKNDFVATVTHELKTPLASTRMLVDTLLEGRCTGETQQREYLELIARENKRLSRLIDNFLTFSRMERNKRSFNFEDVTPRIVVEAAVETVHENYEQSGCKLSVDIADNLPLIVVDKDSMVQVLLNLLDNACKYSDGDKRIHLKVFAREHTVCFRVEDDGIGMAKREQSKILDRFYQVDQSLTRKVGGAGLGLSIVNFIVTAHGGTIDIESELGKGSAFTVKIPVNGGD